MGLARGNGHHLVITRASGRSCWSPPVIRPPSATVTPARRIPSARAAASNGGLPGGVSPSSAAGRRFRDVVEDLTAELGGQLAHAEVLQVRTIAGLVVHAEQLQAAMLKGEPVDSEQLIRVSNSAARMLTALKRTRIVPRAKPGRAGLATYLASKGGAS